MEWSGTRVSAGRSFHSSPSLPLSLLSSTSGAKRHRASRAFFQSKGWPGVWRSNTASRLAWWSKLRCLMSWKSVSLKPPCLPRSNWSPVNGWISVGVLVQRTWAHGATLNVLTSPFLVETVICSIGHCGRSAAAAHQSARCTWRYMAAGMPFWNTVRTRASSLSASIVSVPMA